MFVGLFSLIEDRIFEWSFEKRIGICDRNELFVRLVWFRNFVLIFYELSMTGVLFLMLEFVIEFLSCGVIVNVVVFSRRGGLIDEFIRRRIKVIDDKVEYSFKVVMKVDFVIVGLVVCV